MACLDIFQDNSANINRYKKSNFVKKKLVYRQNKPHTALTHDYICTILTLPQPAAVS